MFCACVRMHAAVEEAEWSRDTPRALNAAGETRKFRLASRHVDATVPFRPQNPIVICSISDANPKSMRIISRRGFHVTAACFS